MTVDEFETLKVYELEPRRKHPTIFEWFDALAPTESFVIENDHDPLPLYYELKAERKDQLGSFEYLQKGPDVWRVRISKSNEDKEAGTTSSFDACAVKSPETRKEPVQTGDACSINSRETVKNETRLLDVTQLKPGKKHPTIFEWFHSLKPGEFFTIQNDHDPKPLYYQMLGQLGPVFDWQYTQQGPATWTVIIQKREVDEPNIGEIAAKDMRKAAAMKKLGIDFCCGGGKSLKQAAADAGMTTEALRQVLEETEQTGTAVNYSFNQWDADFLADYIYNQHHKYFYQNAEDLWQLLLKVKARHGQHNPELHKIASLVESLFVELKLHFDKEEKVLFPYIKELAVWKRSGMVPKTQFQMTKGPLAMMHSEHEAAGDILRSIRTLSNDYQAPDGSCNSFRLLYFKLEELEQDLHQHIHLENNILFPKALQLEKELAS